MRPLLDEPLSGEAAKLLRSAAADAPPHPEASHARVATAMVASPRIEVVTSAAKTIGGAPLALVGLVLVAGSAAFIASRSEEPTPTNARTPSATTLPAPAQPEAPSSDDGTVSAASPLPSLRVEDLPSATPKTIASSAPAAPRAAAVDELAMIDAARADLTAGRPDAALQRVAAYRALGRAQTYAVEADVIEIEALSSARRTADARARAERFLKQHPRSPYEQRVRGLLEEMP
ncbi:MAG: hypothetical protein BGO98_00735 [Myxococcales bacterium 68-20]|nr:MAG: hypothetical protein BGO98_00735 [Myxococcales bacterium 68-20]